MSPFPFVSNSGTGHPNCCRQYPAHRILLICSPSNNLIILHSNISVKYSFLTTGESLVYTEGMSDDLRDWLTVREVADLKWVSQNSVRVAIRLGRIAGEKKGMGYLVRRSVAEAWTPSNRGPKGRRRDEG